MAAIAKTITQDGDVSIEADEVVFNPYNPGNKEVTLEVVRGVLRRYGVEAEPHN